MARVLELIDADDRKAPGQHCANGRSVRAVEDAGSQITAVRMRDAPSGLPFLLLFLDNPACEVLRHRPRRQSGWSSVLELRRGLSATCRGDLKNRDEQVVADLD